MVPRAGGQRVAQAPGLVGPLVRQAGAPPLLGRVHHAGDTVWFPSPELLGYLALCPRSWVAIYAASTCSLAGRGSPGQSDVQPAGTLRVSGARVGELQLAGGQLAELAASPVDTTSTAGEALGVVSGVGPGLGDGTRDGASQESSVGVCLSRPLDIFRGMVVPFAPYLPFCLQGTGLLCLEKCGLKQMGVCVSECVSE